MESSEFDESQQPPQPNEVRNAEEVEEVEEEKEETVPVRGIHMVHEETIKVLASDLRPFFNTKKDYYRLLSLEGQLYLPPYDDCDFQYLRDITAGKRLVLTNEQVR